MHVAIVTEGGEHPLEVDPMETTAEVKQNLEGLLSIPARRQILSCDQPDFFDFMTMEFLGVKENDRIVLTINSEENRYKIMVKISARVISLVVEEMDTVANLKNKIQENIGGLNGQQITLFYKDSKMRDNGRLFEYKLGMNSEIIAALEPVTHSSSAMMLASPKRLSFVVEAPPSLNSMRIPVEMVASSTVNDLRKLLLNKKHLPRDDYIFIHKQELMEDNQSLHWHGVKDGDTIDAFPGYVTQGD